MHKSIILPLGCAALAACATTGNGEPPVRGAGECDASGVQDMVGAKVSQGLGAQLLAQTGAQILRWVPPRTAVTMDYRQDRLTVSYDDDMIVERISCG